jgi:hypothetical protein
LISKEVDKNLSKQDLLQKVLNENIDKSIKITSE